MLYSVRLFYSYLKRFLTEILVINFRYFQTNLSEEKKDIQYFGSVSPQGTETSSIIGTTPPH